MKKTFSNFRTLAALLMAGAAFAACSNDNSIIEQQPANPGEQVYTLTINASKGDGATTRALDIDGTGKLIASWANGDVITVRRATLPHLYLFGTLTASNASGSTATFSGTLTGNINVGEHLILVYHDVDFDDFANQDGTLKGENGAEKYDIAAVQYVDVTGIDDSGDITVTCVDSNSPHDPIPGDPTFATVTSMLKLTLHDNKGHALNPTSLKISVSCITGDLFTFTIPANTYTTNGDGILYFALPSVQDEHAPADAYKINYLFNKYELAVVKQKDQYALNAATVTFTATVDGTDYTASKTGYKFAAGKYYTADLTLGLDGGIATVNDGITGWTDNSFPGALPGLFTIDDAGHKVKFSQGNLLATLDGSSWTWAFAEPQWYYYGSSTIQCGTVDMFGWVGASSTWVNEEPLHGMTTSTSIHSIYGYGNLTGDQGEILKSDWGNVAITNGGGAAGSGWRTLTSAEWAYVFNTRSGATVNSTANVRYTKAMVNGYRGIILFPDGVTFAADEATTWGTLNDDESDYTTQCDDAQWEALAAKGCVFLPSAGRRDKNGAWTESQFGYYWSSTPTTNEKYAFGLHFAWSYLNPEYFPYRYEGCSVRLVRLVE